MKYATAFGFVGIKNEMSFIYIRITENTFKGSLRHVFKCVHKLTKKLEAIRDKVIRNVSHGIHNFFSLFSELNRRAMSLSHEFIMLPIWHVMNCRNLFK